MHTLLTFTAALFASLGLVPILRRWALARQQLDLPDERKLHQQAVPRLGGVAIFLSFFFSVLIFTDLSREVRGILAGGLIVFIVGLIDDFHNLPARWKFTGQVAAVLTTMVVGRLYLVNLGDVFGFGEIIMPLWAAIPFTIMAVVGVCNAINLIDGLDGLSGGVSVIALASILLLAFHNGCPGVMFLSAAMMGAVIGFLKYNLYPARIFMGDAGSLSLGYVLAFLAIFLTQAPCSRVNPGVPVVILGLPVIDAVWVMVRRMMKGNKAFSADRTHVHHKFLDLGLQHRSAVIVIYGISLFWALLAIVAQAWPEYWLLLFYLAGSCLFYGLLRYLIEHRTRFPFMADDSAAGLRQTTVYRRWSARIDRTSPLLAGLFLTYLVMAVIADFSEVKEFLATALTGAAVFAAYWLVIRGRRKSVSRVIVKTIFYLVGLTLVLLTDRALGTDHTFANTEVAVFGLITALVVLGLLFRHEDDTALRTSELVAIIIGIFALIAFPRVPELEPLASVPLRGGILFMAINTVFFTGRGLFPRPCREKPGNAFPPPQTRLAPAPAQRKK